mgnify:CR=1 FL=1
MGQKVNPIGLRLGINRGWDSVWYAKKKDFGNYLIEDFKIRKYIKDNVVNSGVSKVMIERTSQKCFVTIYTSRPGFVIGKKGSDIEKIKNKLSKITSNEVQLNIKESFFGNMFSKNISKSKCTIKSENYVSPFVEPEFSFVMKDELDILKAPYKPEIVCESISAVLPSIELVDSRFEDWTVVGVKNLIADNAVHAHWIYGDEINNLNSINFLYKQY